MTLDELCKKYLKNLNIHKTVKSAYNKGEVMRSAEPLGSLYTLTDKQREMVKMLDNDDMKVFHVIDGVYDFPFGERMHFETYLLVTSKDAENEQLPKECGNGYYVYSYTKNLTDDMCSEYGEIIVANRFGGLGRLY